MTARGSAARLASARIVTTLARLAIDMLAVRVLSKDAVGTFHQAWTVLAILVLCDLGLPTGLLPVFTRTSAEGRGALVRRAMSWLLAATGVVCLALYFAAPFVAILAKNSSLEAVLKWGTLYLVAVVAASGMEAVILASERTSVLAPSSLVGSGVGLAAAAWLVSSHSTATAVVVGLAMGHWVRLAFLTMAAWPILWGGTTDGGDDGDAPGQMMRLSMAALGNRALNLVTGWAGRVVVTFWFAAKEMAVYSIGAWEIPLVGIIYGAVSQATLPDLSARWSRGDFEGVLAAWHQMVDRMTWVVMPLALFAAVWSTEIVVAIFTADYADSVPIFRIYLTLLPLRVAVWSALLLSIGAARELIWGSAIDACVNLVLSVALIPWIGLWAPAIGTVVGTYVQWSIYLNAASGKLGTSWRKLVPWHSIGRNAAIAALVVAPTVGLKLTHWIETIQLGIAAVWTAGVWLVLAWQSGRVSRVGSGVSI